MYIKFNRVDRTLILFGILNILINTKKNPKNSAKLINL